MNCPRTATVISRNYVTSAYLSQNAFRSITNEFPQLLVDLKKSIYKYKDPRKKFFWRVLLQISYLKKMPLDLFHQIYHSFRQHYANQGDVILAEGSDTDNIIVLEKGHLEVYCAPDGNRFVIENLFPGSVFGYRAIFLED